MKIVVSLKCIVFLLIISGCLNDQDKDVDSRQSATVLLPEQYSELENVHAYPVPDSLPYEISLTKVREYADSEQFFFPHINRFAVGDHGRVFIANQKNIEVFDSEGMHIKTLGGRGRGPGEFNNMAILSPKATTNMVYAYDDILRRVNIFRMDSLSLFHTFKIPRRDVSDENITRFRDINMVSDSLLLIGSNTFYKENEKGGYRSYDLFDLQGNIISEDVLSHKLHPAKSLVIIKIGQASSSKRPLDVPTNSHFKVAFDSHQNLYTTMGEDFLIKIYDSYGTYSHAIYYPYNHSPVDREVIIEANSYNEVRKKKIKEQEFPKVWPAIHQLFVDDEGRIWVATIIDDNEHYEWWVLDVEGRLMSKFLMPGKRLIRNTSSSHTPSTPVVKDGYFYNTERDEAMDLNKIVKYEIGLEKRGK